jgi:hypothetical protein
MQKPAVWRAFFGVPGSMSSSGVQFLAAIGHPGGRGTAPDPAGEEMLATVRELDDGWNRFAAVTACEPAK